MLSGNHGMATSFAHDILPKFRHGDVACMRPRHILIDDQAWMCDPASGYGYGDHGKARHVFDRITAGDMPPDAPWSAAWVATYQAWIDGGFLP